MPVLHGPRLKCHGVTHYPRKYARSPKLEAETKLKFILWRCQCGGVGAVHLPIPVHLRELPQR